MKLAIITYQYKTPASHLHCNFVVEETTRQ